MNNKYTESELQTICKHINEQEVNASKAERESIKFKQIEYLTDKIGIEYEAIITSVKDWGIYCEITINKCEGLVSKEDLESIDMHIKSDEHKIQGSEISLRLGDSVKVRVKNVSLSNREIEFDLILN